MSTITIRSPAVPWRWSLVSNNRGRNSHTVAEVIRLVLEVVPGERRLLPEFGWRAHLLAPLEYSAFRGVAALLAEEDLMRWVPDLGVGRVDVVALEAESVLLHIQVAHAKHEVRVRRRGRLQCVADERGGRS